MHEEGEDVESDEVEPEAPGFDLDEAGVGGEVENDAAEGLVDVGVGEEWSDHEEDLPYQGGKVAGGSFNRDGAEKVGAKLAEGRQADCDAVEFLVKYGLRNVCDESDGEEKEYDIIGRLIGAEIPCRLIVIRIQIYAAVRLCGICHDGRWLSC